MTTGGVGGGDSGPSIHHLEVARSARYALLGVPGPSVRQLWVVLHGYRQLAHRFIRRFAHIATPERLILAPEALNRFYIRDTPGRHGADAVVGGTWMTREDRETEIRDYVRYLDRLLRHVQDRLPSPVPTVALGFSQGCHTVARWTAYGESRHGAVIFWGEVLPPDLDLPRAARGWAGTRLLSVQGREDAAVTDALLARQSRQVVEMGVRLELRWHELGHVVEPGVLESLAGELGPE